MQKSPGIFLLGGLVALAACTKPAPAQNPATTRIAVPAGELRALVPGHFIDEQPFPCDGGPLILYTDGRFRLVSGWGDTDGRYTISDGAIRFAGSSGDRQFQKTIRFARGGDGKLYYSGVEFEHERELKLVKMGPGTTWETCGSRWPQPLPPESAPR